jgi:hypothetical protein
MPQLTDEQINRFKDILDQTLQSGLPPGHPPPLATHGAAAEHGGIKEDFCGAWPKAQSLLNMVPGMISWIPNYGSVAALVLRGLMVIGQEIYDQGCPTTNTTAPPSQP